MRKPLPDQVGRFTRGLVPFLASALLLALAFVPASGGVHVWLALVAALIAARKLPLKRLFWLSWLAGYVHCLAVYYWIMIVTAPGALLLPIYLGLYWPLFFVALEFAARRFNVPRPLAALALWPALEWVRGTALTGFPWFYLGHSLYRWPRLIQSADLGGVLFVSAVVMAVNALAAAAIEPGVIRRRRLWFAASAAAVLLANFAYGAWRFATLPLLAGPTVACVQPNVPQSIKVQQTAEEAADIFARLRDYSRSDAVRAADVVFWPETIMPGLVGVDDVTVASGMLADPARILDELELQGILTPDKRLEALRLAAGGTDLIDALDRACGLSVTPRLYTDTLLAVSAAISGKPLVAGAVWAKVDDRGWVTATYNRVYHFGTDGREVDYYDKVHLVPFGEFIPLRDSMPAVAGLLGGLMPVQPVVYPGKDFKVFRVGAYVYGPAICFEDTFSYIGRRYRRLGADVLINLTNDGWFGGSFELEAHLANAVFRAVETRMAVVRAANTGVSAVISPAGVVTARLVDSAGRDRQIEGVLVAPVSVSNLRTLYASVGDAWVAVLLAVIPASLLVRKCCSPT